MKNTQLRIDEPGVYFFRDPVQLLLELNHELLVALWSPERGATGVAMWRPEQGLKGLASMLETLVQKLESTLQITHETLQAKIMGDGQGPTESTRSAHRWLSEHNIPVKAVDVGRGVSRLLRVQCGDGRIGVSYSESVNPTDSLLLQPGTAKDRPGNLVHPRTALVLGGSSTLRQLAKQAIEEVPGVNCVAPTVPEHYFLSGDSVQPDFVLVVDDGMPRNALRGWLKKWKAKNPTGRLLSVEKELPALEPEKLGSFKKALRKALAQEPEKETGTVLSFPAKKKKKIVKKTVRKTKKR